MKRQSVNGIKLSDEDKRKIKEEIIAFYLDEREEELGMIEQEQMMELFMEHLAPIVYNKALEDAKRWFQMQQENLESDYYMLYKEER